MAMAEVKNKAGDNIIHCTIQASTHIISIPFTSDSEVRSIGLREMSKTVACHYNDFEDDCAQVYYTTLGLLECSLIEYNQGHNKICQRAQLLEREQHETFSSGAVGKNEQTGHGKDRLSTPSIRCASHSLTKCQ